MESGRAADGGDPVTAPEPFPTADAVLALADQLRDQVVLRLIDTLGGEVARAAVHPGDMSPDYLTGPPCQEEVTVRITALTPTIDKGRRVSGWQVSAEVKVLRCYTGAADPTVTPSPATLERLARIQQEDAAAVRLAVCQLPRWPQAVIGEWKPRGPQGGVFSGITTVTWFGVDLSCCS